MADEPNILLDREQSTMVSSRTEMLGLVDEDDGRWTLAVYCYEWLGSIDDLIPEDERYDEDGEFKIPEEYDGHRIRGLADGEYLETDTLVLNGDKESVTFDKSTIGLARKYAAVNEWDMVVGFEAAWKRLLEIVG